MEVSILRIFY